MSKEFSMVPLSELLVPISRPEPVDQTKTYRILGAHLYAKGLYIKDIKRGTEIQADKVYNIKKGDFVYNRLFAWKGTFAIATGDHQDCYVSNEFPCFAVKQDRLDPYYLWRYFSCSSTWKEALGLSAGGTPISRNRLKEDKLLAMKMIVPPLEEQQRIVARIEELAAKIEEARGLRGETVEEIEKLVRTSTAKVFEDAYKNGTTRLDNVATLERGKFSHRPRNDPQFFGGEHPWIQIAEIEASNKYIQRWKQTLNDTGLAISRKFPKGTLLISIAATIGAIGILDFDCCIPDSIVAITPKIGTDSEYLYYYLGYLRNHLEQIAPQSAQKNINLEILFPLPIPELNITEQRRIVTYLDSLQTRVDALKQLQSETSAELDAMLPSILDKAFKGEL